MFPIIAGIEEVRNRDPKTSDTAVYETRIAYTYTVNGNKRESSRISFMDKPVLYPDIALELVDKYPKDAEVKVYYKPDDSTQAVLEPGADVSVIPLLVIAVILLGFATVAFIAGMKEMKNLKK